MVGVRSVFGTLTVGCCEGGYIDKYLYIYYALYTHPGYETMLVKKQNKIRLHENTI